MQSGRLDQLLIGVPQSPHLSIDQHADRRVGPTARIPHADVLPRCGRQRLITRKQPFDRSPSGIREFKRQRSTRIAGDPPARRLLVLPGVPVLENRRADQLLGSPQPETDRDRLIGVQSRQLPRQTPGTVTEPNSTISTRMGPSRPDPLRPPPLAAGGASKRVRKHLTRRRNHLERTSVRRLPPRTDLDIGPSPFFSQKRAPQALQRRPLGLVFCRRQHGYRRGILLVAVVGWLSRVVEERGQSIEVPLFQWIVLVVVTPRTPGRQTHEDRRHRLDTVDHVTNIHLLGNQTTLSCRHIAAAKTGSNSLVECGPGQQVAGNLFDDEPVERHVGSEGPNHPVPVGPDLTVVVQVHAVGVAISGSIQPEPGPVFGGGR